MKRLIPAVLMLLVGAMAVAEPQNPPPANALAGYDKYELSPIAMGAPYAGDEGKEKAKAKIQDHMSTEIGPVLAQWNVDAAGNARGQSLVIEPRIEKLKVVSGGARFWAGALAGDSYVVVKLRINATSTAKTASLAAKAPPQSQRNTRSPSGPKRETGGAKRDGDGGC